MKTSSRKKVLILVIIPLFTIFLQGFVRYILNFDFNTIGITLGALGVGQLIPFMYFDHFIANKVLGIEPSYETKGSEFTIKYKLKPRLGKNQINEAKTAFHVCTFLCLALFLITIYLGLEDYILLHILFGGSICIVAWFLLIFKY